MKVRSKTATTPVRWDSWQAVAEADRAARMARQRADRNQRIKQAAINLIGLLVALYFASRVAFLLGGGMMLGSSGDPDACYSMNFFAPTVYSEAPCAGDQ